MYQVSVNVPEAVLFNTKMNFQDAEKFIRRVTALAFFKNNGVSIGNCAKIALASMSLSLFQKNAIGIEKG